MGVTAALVFANIGAAYGTAKSGVGISSMGVMNPGLVMRNIIPVVLSWTSDDKYLYFQEGENSRTVNRIMKVSADGNELQQVVNFKDIIPGGVVTSARINASGDKLVFSSRLGTGAEIWKLEGLFKEH